MKTVIGLPPNYELIRIALNPSKHAIFCYGDTIYNPSNRTITPDIEHHEYIHSKQQGDNPDLWYARYLQDPQFRLEQEIEAYGEQYVLAKENIEKADEEARKETKVLAAGKTQLLRWALESMARALSGADYGNLISYGEAQSKIRNYAKNR